MPTTTVEGSPTVPAERHTVSKPAPSSSLFFFFYILSSSGPPLLPSHTAPRVPPPRGLPGTGPDLSPLSLHLLPPRRSSEALTRACPRPLASFRVSMGGVARGAACVAGGGLAVGHALSLGLQSGTDGCPRRSWVGCGAQRWRSHARRRGERPPG